MKERERNEEWGEGEKGRKQLRKHQDPTHPVGGQFSRASILLVHTYHKHRDLSHNVNGVFQGHTHHHV